MSGKAYDSCCYNMNRMIAEDLMLLCWDDTKGCPFSTCRATLPVVIGGALIVDLMLKQAISVYDECIEFENHTPNDKVLANALSLLSAKRIWLEVREGVRMLGTIEWFEQVREQMVESGMLVREKRLFCRLFPVVRYGVVHTETRNVVRRAVNMLLTGNQTPQDTQPHEVKLAALMGLTGAIDLLDNRAESKKARQRAAVFAEDEGVCRAVRHVIAEQFDTLRVEAARLPPP